MQLKSSTPKQTSLDITSGSIDWRANAELEEIAWMNQKNEYQPWNLSEFVESVRMSESEVGTLSKKIDDMHSNKNPKYNSNYTSFKPTNS